ncbi:MAG: methyltransferase domain-containing protein [Planctomycetes bacterium]|nr:methyltransferase domain-containing protein [Planctomycetota bacterium]
MTSVRRVALEILFEVHHRVGTYAQERIQAAVRAHKLNKRERRFLTELVLGVMRHERTLDCIVMAFSSVNWGEVEPRTREALRLGVYQLIWLDGVPPFASVGETVEALQDKRAKGFVNAVLRAVDRLVRRVPLAADRGGASPRKRLQIGDRKVCFFPKPVFADPERDLAAWMADVYAHPRELVARWLARHGPDTTRAILEKSLEPPPLFVRVNRRLGTREQLLDLLRGEDIKCGEGNLPESVRVLAPAGELVATKCFLAGRCTVQDETAMLVAPQFEPKAGQLLLDLCAAPGGKTTHLAELADDQATIMAVDRDETRLERLRESIARLGLKSISCMVADASDPAAVRGVTPAPYDGVLVDAPCSNSGVLARRPEAKARLAAIDLTELVAIQRKLLDAAVQLLFAGGRLVYSTCSIEPEENGDQVRALLERSPDLELEAEQETLPTHGGGDGGYFAVLRKKGQGLPTMTVAR